MTLKITGPNSFSVEKGGHSSLTVHGPKPLYTAYNILLRGLAIGGEVSVGYEISPSICSVTGDVTLGRGDKLEFRDHTKTGVWTYTVKSKE